MPDVTINYKNSTVTSLNDSGTIILKTAEKYCENNVVVTYDKVKGIEGIPIVTKGTVENNSVVVTPSVTNIEGYIDGSIKTGQPVTISASELVSGTKAISRSGIIDVTNYAMASISEGSAKTPETIININPSISINENGLITININESEDITPTITEGYILSGTAGTILVNGSKTQQLPLYNGGVS